MSHIFRSHAVVLAGLFCSWGVFAQQTAFDPHAPTGYTGTVVSTASDSVTLKQKDGNVVSVGMSSGWTLVIPQTQGVASIKIGDFIATPNVDIDSGSGRSTEVRIMEPGYRPEVGTHPMGKPGTSMTHGTVTVINPTGDGLDMEVTYTGGTRHLIVPADTKVITYEVHPNSYVKVGMAVTAVVRKDADNVSRAERLILAE